MKLKRGDIFYYEQFMRSHKLMVDRSIELHDSVNSILSDLRSKCCIPTHLSCETSRLRTYVEDEFRKKQINKSN